MCKCFFLETLVICHLNSFNLTRSTFLYFKLYHLSFEVCMYYKYYAVMVSFFWLIFTVVALSYVRTTKIHGRIVCTMEMFSIYHMNNVYSTTYIHIIGRTHTWWWIFARTHAHTLGRQQIPLDSGYGHSDTNTPMPQINFGKCIFISHSHLAYWILLFSNWLIILALIQPNIPLYILITLEL